MAEMIRYALVKPARMLSGDVTKKSTPPGVQNATPKFNGIWGVEEVDFEALKRLQVGAIKGELGKFTNPDEYHLCCMSGKVAADRELKKAELKAEMLEAQGDNDGAAKAREKAESKAELYRGFAGILKASSQFDVALAQLKNGKIADIPAEEHARAQAGKDLFYPGSFQVVNIGIKAYRRKQVDGKDGVTAYLNNVLFVRNGEKLFSSGGASSSQVFGGFASAYSEVDPTALATSNSDVAEENHDF